ncbi:helix-turn-helix domain-containing protein [Candidatus Sodalis sp. SoCistrobi]|uniref:helix-turn-helix transcriptional regulator n=1 Tax=Candidatus Sodalis sp. SoCistrobi TaxID=1922216 RepID=UPI000938A5DB
MTAFEPESFLPYHKIFPELSSSELKVLSLYCSGFNLQFIAEYLDIKINTVHVHMKNAMHKYNSTSYSELKAFFYFIVIGYIIQNDNVRVEISRYKN